MLYILLAQPTTITMKDKGQGLMGLTLVLYWVGTRPSKGCRVYLCHFIALSRRGCDKHSVSKNNVRKLCIPQHLVIGWEAMGEGWVKTCYHPVLCCHDHCMCCTIWGYHSSSGQDLGVN